MSARVHVRYDGTDMALPVPFAPCNEMRKSFEAEHRARFGFIYDGKPLVAEAVEVEGEGGGADISEPELAADGSRRNALEDDKLLLRRRASTRPASSRATRFGPATASPARRSSWSRIRRSWSSPAGRRR